MTDKDNSGEWSGELDELDRRRELACRMGGEQALEKMRSKGRYNARQRIDLLLDRGSFRELGRITGRSEYDDNGDLVDLKPVNAIIGTGRIDKRKVAVSADDFSVAAGSSEGTISDKWIYIERLALAHRMPLVRLVDSAGGSVRLIRQMETTRIPGYPHWDSTALVDSVPVVGIALGSCAGLAAIKVLAANFSVMVRDQAQVFAAGPPVVKQAYGVDISKEDLGGARLHRKSALVHNEAEDEQDAFDQARRFLSYMPRNAWRIPQRIESGDDTKRADEWLKDAVPHDRRKVYDPRPILESVFDKDSVFEIGARQGRSIITALARLDGVSVGVLAGDPRSAGAAMSSTSAYKMERHIRLCSTFGLPIVHFVDQPGNATGLEAERAGTLLGALRVGEAVERAQVPWVSIIVRRAFGMAGAMHAPKVFPAIDYTFAWPSARWGSIPIEGGVAAAHRQEIAEADDPEAKREELEARYQKLGSPFRTAERFGVVDIIDPRETRSVLCDWVEDAREVLETER